MYATRTFKTTVESYQTHCDNMDGICLACGEWTCGGVEPDAEGYVCEFCEQPKVMGAEQALMEEHLVAK